MTFVNVGAYVGGKRPKTKKALREALASDPRSVQFDPTAMFGEPAIMSGGDLPAGKTLSVVGPDPYRDRRWYATVELVNGKVKLS